MTNIIGDNITDNITDKNKQMRKTYSYSIDSLKISTVRGLRNIARKKNIKGFSTMRKPELITAILESNPDQKVSTAIAESDTDKAVSTAIAEFCEFKSSKDAKSRKWEDVKELCNSSRETLRDLVMKAHNSGTEGKAFAEAMPSILADYVKKTGDNSDFDWLPEPLVKTTITILEARQPNLVDQSLAVPTPEEFFNHVIALSDRLAVHQACNELLDALAATKAVSTISKNLSKYKALFYSYQHQNPELNEIVETKKGSNTQHIAARLLSLSDEQKKILSASRENSDNARAGFDADGELREIEKPPIDISAIIKKSCELLTSNNAYTIGCGILNLTGLRANEQNMPAREYPEWGVITRDMVVLDEFVIGFKGISKKHDLDDANAYHARITLAPARMIVEAQKRFQSCKEVQVIPTDYEKYRKGFQDTFSRRFNELFGHELSTIEAYDDEGHLTAANGSPHKARAFYACALRAMLKAKKFGDSASNKYIQLCLAHESVGITIKYLGRYDEKEFVNPVDLNIPSGIKKLGKVKPLAIETNVSENKIDKLLETRKPTKASFDIDAFINGLDGDLQIRFNELLVSDSSLTNAILALIKIASANKKEVMQNKVSVSDEVHRIITAIMDYNAQQTLNTNCVVPSYALINKISDKYLNKSIYKKTIDDVLKSLQDDIATRLMHKDIKALEMGQWNAKYHRRTLNTVIDNIITILNK